MASEVGTQSTLRPAATLSPSAATKRAAVDPVPSPSRIPSVTRSSAARAALSLSSSVLVNARSPRSPAAAHQHTLRSLRRRLPGRKARVTECAMFKDATIVFDLDGTLVDTAPDLTNALNDVLVRRGHEPVEVEAIRGCVGHGARVMIEQSLRRAGARDDVDRMLAEFLVHYEANIASESRPFPGAVAALELLAAPGRDACHLHQQAREPVAQAAGRA